jgi:tRNA 2-selenouridine synthase
MGASGNTTQLAADLLEAHYDPSYERAIGRNFSRYRNALVLRVDDAANASFRALARQLLDRSASPQAA